jgi:hypothetical protein
MLRERLDRLERLLAAGSLPVGQQLRLVKSRPFGHERQGTTRQRTCDQLAVECDRGGVAAVPSVEVRPSVDALVPLHPDPDPVEEADPRHAKTLRATDDGRRRWGRQTSRENGVVARVKAGAVKIVVDAHEGQSGKPPRS